MVGFNRRFSPHVQKVKQTLGNNSMPITIIANMNAGAIPKSHWVHDLNFGGGRIIGEACHLIDLCVFLTGSMVSSVCMNGLGNSPELDTDNANIFLNFTNGSIAVINYFSNGSKKYSKERLEVHAQGRSWIIDNYQLTKAYGVPGFNTLKTKIDKGHRNQFKKYIQKIRDGGDSLIPINHIINVTRASLAAIDSLQRKSWVELK